MTALFFYDAAYVPNLARVKKAPGALGINGYLTGRYATTTTQPVAAHKAGLGWLPTYEEGPSELVGASRATGRAVGNKILAALKAKRVPLDGTIAVYPSVDVNVPRPRATSCNNGWRGIRDVLHGKVSIRAYAEGAVIDALANAGLVDGKCWLAAPTSWPGFNVDDVHICMVQLVGTNVPGTDRNHLVTDPHGLGAWWPAGSPYADAPPPPKPPVPTPTPGPVRPLTLGRNPDMIVVRISKNSMPKGKPWPGWFTFDGQQLAHLTKDVAGVDNGAQVLAACGQKTPAEITYEQYLAWGGK